MSSNIETIFDKANHLDALGKVQGVSDFNFMLKVFNEFANKDCNDLVEHCLAMFMAKLYLDKSKSYVPKEGANLSVVKDVVYAIVNPIVENYMVLNTDRVYQLTVKYIDLYRAQRYHEMFPRHYPELEADSFLMGFLGYTYVMSKEVMEKFNKEKVHNLYSSIVKGIKILKPKYDPVLV